MGIDIYRPRSRPSPYRGRSEIAEAAFVLGDAFERRAQRLRQEERDERQRRQEAAALRSAAVRGEFRPRLREVMDEYRALPRGERTVERYQEYTERLETLGQDASDMVTEQGGSAGEAGAVSVTLRGAWEDDWSRVGEVIYKDADRRSAVALVDDGQSLEDERFRQMQQLGGRDIEASKIGELGKALQVNRNAGVQNRLARGWSEAEVATWVEAQDKEDDEWLAHGYLGQLEARELDALSAQIRSGKDTRLSLTNLTAKEKLSKIQEARLALADEAETRLKLNNALTIREKRLEEAWMRGAKSALTREESPDEIGELLRQAEKDGISPDQRQALSTWFFQTWQNGEDGIETARRLALPQNGTVMGEIKRMFRHARSNADLDSAMDYAETSWNPDEGPAVLTRAQYQELSKTATRIAQTFRETQSQMTQLAIDSTSDMSSKTIDARHLTGLFRETLRVGNEVSNFEDEIAEYRASNANSAEASRETRQWFRATLALTEEIMRRQDAPGGHEHQDMYNANELVRFKEATRPFYLGEVGPGTDEERMRRHFEEQDLLYTEFADGAIDIVASLDKVDASGIADGARTKEKERLFVYADMLMQAGSDVNKVIRERQRDRARQEKEAAARAEGEPPIGEALGQPYPQTQQGDNRPWYRRGMMSPLYTPPGS